MMPTAMLPMAKSPKRPRDKNQLVKLMTDILTGAAEDGERALEKRGVGPALSPLAKKGGPARAASMTPATGGDR
jgi:hypothetical protein